MMKYLPLGLHIEGKTCVVVGGGPIGERKVLNLLRAGGQVLLVAPRATPVLQELWTSKKIEWAQRAFETGDLDGAFLAVAATDDEALNGQIVAVAVDQGTLICDASSAERSQVIFGALHRGRSQTVAVFTDGADPSRARQVRDQIARLILEEEEPESPDQG